MNDDLINVKTLKPFTRFIYTIGELPSSYLISMTYEEQLIWFCNYLSKTVIPAINNNGQAVEELQTKYIELKSYVDNYFSDLDIQEEINNKLDDMVESGELENLISQYIELATTYVYNTIDELKEATNLINGCYARTSGYFSYNDGGGAYYKIRSITNQDTVDEMFIIELNDPSLIAERIVQYQKVNSVSLGIKNDGETDITTKLQNAINYCGSNGLTLFMQKGSYLINDSIIIQDRIIIEGEQLPKVWETTGSDVKILCNLTNKPAFVICKNGTAYDWSNYDSNLLANVILKNITIKGDSVNYSLCAIYNDTYLSKFENIFIENFKNGICSNGSYETDYINVITYNTLFGFISVNCNTTTRLKNCWFENINTLLGDEVINDSTFRTIYSILDNYVYTCIANYNGRIVLEDTAIEFNNYGIYNKNGFVKADFLNIENIYNTDLLCNSSGTKSFIDITNGYIWSPSTLNAYVCKVYNTNSKINLELLNKLPDSSVGHSNGYEIAENAICRVFSMIDGERVIETTKTNIPNSANIIEKSHFTKNGFKIDIRITDYTDWDGTAISKLTGIPNNRNDFKFIGIGTTDIKLFKLSQYGNLTMANNDWINGLSGYDMYINYEFTL